MLQILIKTDSLNKTQPVDKSELASTVKIETTTRTAPIQSSIIAKTLETTTITTKTSQTSTEFSSPSTLQSKQTTITPVSKKDGDSEFNWSSIMNDDSDKTIYESFYELLDNSSKNI